MSIFRQKRTLENSMAEQVILNEYVASSSYAFECPIPFNDPAVASERCVSRPLSERPTFITRRSNTSRLDRKSDELQPGEGAPVISGTIRFGFHRTGHVLIRISIDVQRPQYQRVGGRREQTRVQRYHLIVKRGNVYHLYLFKNCRHMPRDKVKQRSSTYSMVYDISQRFDVNIRYFAVGVLRRVRYVK